MLKSQKSIRTISRIALFAIVGGTLLPSNAAVKEFLAFQPTQASIVSAQRQEMRSTAVETVARVGGTTWIPQTSNTANNPNNSN